jgi:hypothetical protein
MKLNLSRLLLLAAALSCDKNAPQETVAARSSLNAYDVDTEPKLPGELCSNEHGDSCGAGKICMDGNSLHGLYRREFRYPLSSCYEVCWKCPASMPDCRCRSGFTCKHYFIDRLGLGTLEAGLCVPDVWLP